MILLPKTLLLINPETPLPIEDLSGPPARLSPLTIKRMVDLTVVLSTPLLRITNPGNLTPEMN